MTMTPDQWFAEHRDEVTEARTTHNPETCTREHCGRCDPPAPGTPVIPVVEGSLTDERRKGKIDRMAPPILTVQPHALASSLERTASHLIAASENVKAIPPRLHRYGPETWHRVLDWERKDLPRSEPDDEDEQAQAQRREATSDDRRDELRDDAHAARYADELRRLTNRITARQRLIDKACNSLDADLSRLDRIITITNPDAPARVGSKDMLAAQVAADGWCVSCWRDEQHLTEITKRPSGEPWYRDLCRSCGQWKAENGELPPLDLLRQRHGKSKPKRIA